MSKNKEIELYPDIKDKDFYQKLFEKKEYNILYRPPDKFDNYKPFKTKQLQPKSHQIFASHFINPNTPYKRTLLYYQTGSGKTLAAFLIAKNYIEQYKILYENKNTFEPKIIILGFTKDNIKAEFLRFPELGFVTQDELNYLTLLKDKYGTDSIEYKNEKVKYMRRLKNPNYGGFFTFYGYMEVVNRLFIFKKISIEQSIFSINDLYKEIRNGNIEINREFLNNFKDTLIICDEIHNIYNSVQINNYGMAILYILINNPNTKLVGLSATPLNNNPREIIDLINIFSVEKLEDVLDHSVYFNIINEKDETTKLHQLENLVIQNMRGKVLLYENIDLRYYPSRQFMGEFIPNLSLIPFVRCYMSDYFFDNYINLVNFNKSDEEITLNISNNIYEDIILPDNILDEKQLDNKTNEFKKKYDLYINNGIFYGDFFLKNNLKKYSTKYYEMLVQLEKTKGKVFIYHKFIHKSGVLMIDSILKTNGYVPYDGLPNDFSICLICRKILKEHKKLNHEFIPIKYITLTSLIDTNLRKEYRDLFNNTSNTLGKEINIIIGSQVVEEGIELKSVNDIFIMTLPTNISTFIQVIGRCIRTNSHILLPPEKQYVNISTFVTSMTEHQKNKFIDKFSVKKKKDCIFTVDETHYLKKIKDHLQIQILERVLKEIAIDGPLYDLNIYDDNLSYSFTPFKYAKVNFNKINLNSNTYFHYDFINNLIEFSILFIKELFLRYKVLSLEEIYYKFESNDFHIEYNTSLIDKNLIPYILNKLVVESNIKNFLKRISVYTIPEHKIIKIEEYYVLVKINHFITNDLLTKDKFNKKISLLNNIPNIDNIYNDIFEEMISKIKSKEDFLNIILNTSNSIPHNFLTKLLQKSKNNIINKILNIFSVKRKKFNNIIGIIDNKYKFLIKENSSSKFNLKGIGCNSLKKQELINYFNILNIKEDDNLQTYILCDEIKKKLFYLHLDSNDTEYFKINFL